jgi:DNA-binding MarR family transcriptional regulator
MGTNLIDEAATDLLAVEAQLLAGLPERDRRSLAQLLGKLSTHLDGSA